jgi:hypothetical protein
MMNRLVLAAAVVVTLVPGTAQAEPASTSVRMATRADIDRACDKAMDFAETNASGGFTFWDVTAGLTPAAGEGLWWRIDDIQRWAIADLDPLGPHGPNTQVSVWKTPDHVLLAAAFFTSDSGDWAYFVDYCYRPDATLARTSSTLNSFVASDVRDGIRRQRTRYFNAKAKVIGSRSAVSNLGTGSPLQIQVAGFSEPAYTAVDKLPFYPLLTSAFSQACPQNLRACDLQLGPEQRAASYSQIVPARTCEQEPKWQ